ncbi:MAG: hypothetical protein IPL90_14480 [Holophagales bacterium]|nr:hypothetical protein [Holophagales bacterium]
MRGGAGSRGPLVAIALALSLLGAAGKAGGQTVFTVAGGGVGDGGPAASADLGMVGDLVVDASGDVYLTDFGHGSLRRIDRRTGVITTLLRLEKGDSPRYLEMGAPGRLLFTSAYRVEELELATGRRRPIAGNGEAVWLSGSVQVGRTATEIPLGGVTGLAVDARGGVYFGDSARAQILYVDPATGRLELVFARGRVVSDRENDAFKHIHDLAISPAGKLYYSDTRHSQIFLVESGRATAVAGNGEVLNRTVLPGIGSFSAASPLYYPGPLAFRSADELAFGEDLGTVRFLDRSRRIRTLLGSTPGTYRILGLAFDREGAMFAASNPAHGVGQVLKVVRGSGEPQILAGSGVLHCCGDGAPGRDAELAGPEGVAVAPNGDVLIADRANNRIRSVSARTGRISTIAGGGLFALPGSRKTRGRPLRTPPPPGRMHGLLFEIVEPRFLAADSAGNVYFAQSDGPVFRIEERDGAVVALAADRKNVNGESFPDGFAGIGGIAVDRSGAVFVAAESRVWRISPDGRVEAFAGTGHEGFAGDGAPALLADLSRPAWPAVDGSGALTFVDGGNSRIRKVDRSGKISTIAGNGLGFASGEGQAIREAIGNVTGLAFDPLGNLHYATGDNRIWRLTFSDGRLRVIAGRELGGGPPSPDGPLGSVSRLGKPRALAFDGRGILYFSEPDTSKVRGIRP